MIKKYDSFNEGIKNWFRKNDFVLKGFIGRRIRLKIGNDIEEKEIINDPSYGRSVIDGSYDLFNIIIKFKDREQRINNIDPLGEEEWQDEDGDRIHSITIKNGQELLDIDRYNPGSFDWDSVPRHIEIEETYNHYKIQTDKDGVSLIKDLIIAISDKEVYVDGEYKNKGFHSLKDFVQTQLKRGDSIFESNFNKRNKRNM